MISSTDSVLVRAAASSIASGRPSSERHSSCTSAGVARPGGAAGEQLHRVGERERRELEHGLAVDVERDLARAQDPQRRARRRAAASASAAAASTTCSQLSRISTAPARREPLEQRRLAAGDARARRSPCRARRRRSWRPRAGRARRRPARRSARPAAIASAVLPMPPGPTISTSRCVAEQRRRRRPMSASRPTSSADERRRLPAARGAAARAPGRGRGSAARARAAAGRARGRARRRAAPRTRW